MLKGMNESNTSAIQEPSKEDVETLVNMLSSFLIKTPDKFGWWCRIPTPSKGIDSVVEKLFPHLGTLFGMPDHATCKLL